MTMLSQKIRPALGALLLASALAACTVGPDYTPPAATAPAHWQGQQTIADFNELQSWWSAFHDAELDHLVTLAVAGNLDVKIAEQRIIEARSQRDIAKAAYLPTLSGKGQTAAARLPRDLDPLPGGKELTFVEGGLDASWEIDLFGKTKRSVESADASLGSTLEDRRAVLVSLLGEIGQDYAALRSAQARLQIAERNVEAEQGFVELTRAKQAGGLGSELEVAQAQAQLATLTAVIPQLQTIIAQQSNALALLLGLEPGALTVELSAPGALPPAPPSLPAALPLDVVRNRPDIRSAERQIAAANAQIGVAEAQRYPSLTISPSIALAGGNIHQMLQAASTLWIASAASSVPIYDGGKIDANVRSAEAATEEARLNYRKTVLTAFRDVEDALVAYESEQRRYQALIVARDADHRALDRATSLYRAGLGDFLNVLDGERSLYAAEDALAQSELTLTQQTVALYKAFGAGWQVGES